MLKKLQDMLALKVSASRSVYDDPLQKYKFVMTVAGMPSGAGFTKLVAYLKKQVLLNTMKAVMSTLIN